MKSIPLLMLVVAIKTIVFLFPIWTKTAETVHSKETLFNRRARETQLQGLTTVVNHAFCDSSLSDEDKMTQKTLKEIHTYAELKFDPHKTLPESFTICSSMMIPSCPTQFWPSFFSILDKDRAQFFSPTARHRSMTSLLKFYYLQASSKHVFDKIPPIFPNQWTRSCLAINLSSGLITWVVEGVLVLNTTSDELGNSTSRPENLSRKLVLGARPFAGAWRALSSKVTNVNIFSSSLSVERMQRMTEEGSCVEKGDYLAWEDMEWVLHGKAKIETVDYETTCKRKSYMNLFYTSFEDWEACMRHCEKLGSRVPSVSSLHDWLKIQKSLKEDLFDKGLYTKGFWLPISDRRREDEWRDFYVIECGRKLHSSLEWI